MFKNKIILEAYNKMNETSMDKIIHGHHNDNGYCIISAGRGDWNSRVGDEQYSEIFDNDLPPFEEWKDENSHSIEVKDEEKLISIFNKRANEIAEKKLKEDLKNKGYSYNKSIGGYKEDNQKFAVSEFSFIVYPTLRNGEKVNFESLVDDMTGLGEKYAQDTILVRPAGEQAYYLNTTDRTTIDSDGNPYEVKKGTKDMEFDKDSSKWQINNTDAEYFTSLKRRSKKVRKGDDDRFSLTENEPRIMKRLNEAYMKMYTK